jgi:hypothetical protein
MKLKLILCFALVLSVHCHAAIIFPEAPEEGWLLASSEIKDGLQTNPKFYKGLKIEDLTITNALKAYDFSPQNVISNTMLSSAKFGSWLHLFADGNNAVFSVWTSLDPNGKLRKPSSVSGGSFYGSILVGLQKAEELPQVQKQDYECRYLDLPFLFHAIWLHGKSDDIIIPLPPTWNEWNAYQPYSESEITKLLKPEAEQKIKMAKKDPHLTD